MKAWTHADSHQSKKRLTVGCSPLLGCLCTKRLGDTTKVLAQRASNFYRISNVLSSIQVRWILSTNRGYLVELPPEKQLAEMRGEHHFSCVASFLLQWVLSPQSRRSWQGDCTLQYVFPREPWLVWRGQGDGSTEEAPDAHEQHQKVCLLVLLGVWALLNTVDETMGCLPGY